ncbi:hypothetical protein GEW_06347 [Pasteurella multocida subsp. gallicida str. Anand1_poultry]|nr:hypothetical protein GEW_06347 [Pasteurella multocida subsp. gallicida str. Anand1_poultry]
MFEYAYQMLDSAAYQWKKCIGYEIMNEKNHEETLDVMKFLRHFIRS